MTGKTNPWAVAGMAVLYLVQVYVACNLGILHPACWAYFPVAAALLAAAPYYWLASRIRRFGVGTSLALIFLLLCVLTGEAAGVLPRVIILASGILSDVLRFLIGNGRKKALYFSYPLLALSSTGMVIRLWSSPEWYYEGAVEEMGIEYAKGLAALQSPLYLALLVVAVIAVAVFSIRLFSKIMRKDSARLR